MSEINKELLVQYGTKKEDIYKDGVKSGEVYVIGCLEVYTNGVVWLDHKVKSKHHFVGCLETIDCLKEICEMWNKKQLDYYKN